MSERTSDEIEALRGRAQDLDDHLQVGKGGLSEGFVDEVESQLSREGLVKVRLLRSARAGEETDAMAEELAERADAILVETRGNTVVLYDPKGDR